MKPPAAPDLPAALPEARRHGKLRPRPAACAGVTMVELVVVIVILGILAATAYPRLSTDRYDEAGFGDQVAATLAFARKAAVAQRRWVQILCSPSTNTISVRIANGAPDTPAGKNFTPGGSRPLVLPGRENEQIAPRGATRLACPTAMLFSPLGDASITSGSFVYTVSGAVVRTITVDQATGHVY